MDLGRLSLRERERGFLGGGTQVGKTTLADALGTDFVQRYYPRRARRLISDTKPRYRAELLPNGLPARRLYKNWDHGPVIRGSVLAETVDDMRNAFKLGHRTVIVSSRGWAAKHDELIGAFLDDSRRGRPQLLQVDEARDHFHGNGIPRGSGQLVVVARAGAERGTAGLYCSQRTKGVSGDLLEQMEKLYAFRLDNRTDAKRYQEFGAPEFEQVTEPHVFKYWTKRDYGRVYGPYRLNLGRRG